MNELYREYFPQVFQKSVIKAMLMRRIALMGIQVKVTFMVSYVFCKYHIWQERPKMDFPL
jgi:hypothetical protein